ncbi:MAG: hypothetical protein M3Y41_13775 [Pseudomonadota bacterium]|nr:hypothetical protein [Pseudomonadota bacterium]
MPDYKFLNSAHINCIIVDGTVRISTLSYYRKLEKEQWIADCLEGSVGVNISNLSKNSNEDLGFAPKGFPEIYGAGTGNGMVFIRDTEIRYYSQDTFIFSASRGDLPSLTKTMCQDSKDPYDACVRIVNMELLAHRMFHRGVVVEMGNTKVNRLFSHFHCAPVVYDDLRRDPKTTRLPQPSPFLKHSTFAPQREIRIALQPRQAIPLQNLTIKIPHPEKAFVEEFRKHLPIMP